MACTHDAIRCTNGVKYCLKCGAELPADFTPGKNAPAQEKAAEKPVESGKRTRKKVN